MKKNILIALVLLFSFSAFAQRDKEKQHEKIKALKVAHITEQLDLTTKEAEAFWPIYNKFEEERHKIRESYSEKRKRVDAQKLTESQAEQLVKEMQELEATKFKMDKDYVAKLSKIISYKKIVLLFNSERTFKKKMIEEYRGRHRKN
ncbi:hypothetical protein DZC78_05190 [Olleya aquimaris]|uniref:hypothetical protein n=1 Tax=Olleya sp. ITB9 TaxID=1715648 RepID=UPI0006CFE4F2|nr:hypothetical protein [Olleya sp. ITB9]AXO79805.1 hypothetical protein DZC78_05190 [Olleya aquimaris]